MFMHLTINLNFKNFIWQPNADVEVNSVSVPHGSETVEVETSYYDQCVAPILNEMSGYVHVESSGGMAQRLYMYCILLLAFSCLLAFYNAQLTC